MKQQHNKEKDVAERSFVGINEIFASIINAAIFNYEKVVNETELTDASPYIPFKDDNRVLRSRIGDVHKFWNEQRDASSVILCRFGLENETDHKREIGLKVMGYLGNGYYNQTTTGVRQTLARKVSAENPSKEQQQADDTSGDTRAQVYYYPVFVVVLNFGQTEWENIRLADCLNYPEGDKGAKLRKAAETYGITIPVMNMAFIPPEEAEQHGLHPDLCKMISILWSMRTANEPVHLDEEIQYVDEFRQLMQVLLDLSDQQALEMVPRKDRGGITMGSVWRNCTGFLSEEDKKKAEARGKAEGKAEGEAVERVNTVERFSRIHHISLEESCAQLGYRLDEYLGAKRTIGAIALSV
ncbi:MAG: hypothetical protein IJ083_18210 [Clostridia bacterium]|nr:hypothetical protein [Clostridia bacterium]